jgi:hypothetical protein
LLADAVRKAKHEADKEKKARLHHNKGVAFNINMEEPLARTEDELNEYMLMLGNAIGTCKAYLKRQFDARVARATVDEFNYPGIGPIFRDKAGKKLKKTPSSGEDHVDYLKKLVLLMMKADSRRNSAMNEAPSLVGLVRHNPVIDPGSTDPRSQRAKSAQELTIGHQARQVDDPWLVQLEKDYLGKLCFLHDISMRHKLYRICKISYWPSSRTRNACWEATMEPIHVRHDGDLFLHDDDVVPCSGGRRLTKSTALLGYVLVEYVAGDSEEPTPTDCVDKYIMNALEKHHVYTTKTLCHVRPH